MLVLPILIGGAAPSAHAEDGGFFGFLSSLGGGGNTTQAPATAPAVPDNATPLTVRRSRRRPTGHAGLGRSKITGPPGKAGPVSIYADPTLRDGDAVMTKDGIRIFSGPQFSPARPYVDADFVAVSASRAVGPALKKTLIELNKLPHG